MPPGPLALGQITMFKAAMVAAALMIVTRCCRIEQARRAIDWQVLLAIAASFACRRRPGGGFKHGSMTVSIAYAPS